MTTEAEKLLEGARVLQERDREIESLKARLKQVTIERDDLKAESAHIEVVARQEGWDPDQTNATHVQWIIRRLKEAHTAALYYGEHHELCEAPENASKVYDTCTCGFSEFLTGFGINNYVEVLKPTAESHLQYGQNLRRLKAMANIPPCDCGYSKSDTMTNHHEECAYVRHGRKYGLEVVAVDQRAD